MHDGQPGHMVLDVRIHAFGLCLGGVMFIHCALEWPVFRYVYAV